MNKKILILCDLFPPAFAPRMGYLCKYLQENGWEATVVTEKVHSTMFAFLTGNCPATYISFYQDNGTWIDKLRWAIVFLADLFFGYKDRVMVKRAEKLIQENSFDLILCSTYRTYPLPAAMKLSQKYNLPFIADNRDIMEQFPKDKFFSRPLPALFGLERLFASYFYKKLLKGRNRALQAASCVTTVSPWHVDFLKQYNSNVRLIYNGFDPELFYPAHTPTEQFVITFTGRLVNPAMGNPRMLLGAVQRLMDEGLFTSGNCRVDWYVDESTEHIIRTEANRFTSVDSLQHFHRFLPANEIPPVLHRSSVLLIMCTKSDENRMKGLMGTKFFEALGVEKPVLCVESDEGYLEATIRETCSGLAARTEEEAYRFLRETYAQWKEQGFTSAPVRREIVDQFSRKAQANQFAELFNTITKEE